MGRFSRQGRTLHPLSNAAANGQPGGRPSSQQYGMPRPTLLVSEPEPVHALSVRKLVLETAKFNVLTADSAREALDLFQMFPNISAAVLVADEREACKEVAKSIRETTTKVPIIILAPTVGYRCENADHHISSYEPEKLLELVRSLFGDPRTKEPPSGEKGSAQ